MTSDKPQPTPEEKRRAHFLKAKKAALGLAAEKGGTCSMGEMHSLTESRFFIAHQQFSHLLEECVDEGLVEVDTDEGNVVLTDAGRAFAAGT